MKCTAHCLDWERSDPGKYRIVFSSSTKHLDIMASCFPVHCWHPDCSQWTYLQFVRCRWRDDISKAFHKVWHAGLLHKLKAFVLLTQSKVSWDLFCSNVHSQLLLMAQLLIREVRMAFGLSYRHNLRVGRRGGWRQRALAYTLPRRVPDDLTWYPISLRI